MTSTFGSIELKILVLEDSVRDLELIREQLSDSGYSLDLVHVEDEDSFASSLRENSFNVILSDFKLNNFNAFGALQICKEICPEVPFICISGSIGEETAIELLKMGAVDYVLKDRPERLPFAIKRALDEAKEKANHQKAQQALRESEYRFKQVAEDAQEWIWEINAEGIYTYVSPVSSSLLGYSPDEIIGKKHFYDFFVPEIKDELKSAAFEVFKRSETFRHFENPNVHKNGNIIIFSTSGSPILDANGSLLGYRGVDTDITERKKIIEDLLLAKEKAEESDKLKTAFLTNMSHEIRTPLNGILGFSDLLLDPDLDDEDREKYIRVLQLSGQRMLNTVNDIIEISRIESGLVSIFQAKFDVNRRTNELYQFFVQEALAKGLNMSVVELLPPSVSIIVTDQQKFDSILSNLLKNAIKYTDKGSIKIGCSLKNDQLEFYVRDTGIGIPANRRDAIFDRFVQADIGDTKAYQGSGLGLSIAKSYVEMLGGKIWVESEEEIGSCFYFAIPRK